MNQEKFNRIVNRFKSTRDKNGNILNMNNLLIKQDQKIFSYNFKNRNKPSDIRSISKTVLAIAASILMDLSEKGEYPSFTEETYIYPILADVINLTNTDNENMLKKIQVKHLFNHTVGYDEVLLMRGDIAHLDPFTYLDYLVNYPIKYEPGEYYLYSNAGFYLLSAVLEEFIKEDLLEFIDRNLFKKLDIDRSPYWAKYGKYLAGATRLWLYPKEVMKIGELIMNKGVYNNKRIVSNKRIEKMLDFTAYTPEVDIPEHIYRRYAYGKGLWLAKENIYFGHGTDGQTLAMIPDKNAIIVALAEQRDVFPLEMIVNDIIIDHL